MDPAIEWLEKNWTLRHPAVRGGSYHHIRPIFQVLSDHPDFPHQACWLCEDPGELIVIESEERKE